MSLLISLIMALMAMAFFTLLERKYLGYSQLRKGPNKVMFLGLPQPMADAMKLFLKEQNFPVSSNKLYFVCGPMLSLVLALFLWSLFPSNNPGWWFKYSVLFFLCVSSVNVYSIMLSGWGSNSKYALLGSLRGVAQTISYEISMALILLIGLLMKMSMDMSKISFSSYSILFLMMFPVVLMWFVTNLAETNRTPFDFAEGESELVSGFNIEYGSSLFALIFMAEYCNILFMSLVTSLVFFTFVLKFLSVGLIIITMFLSSMFIWVRATYPRMRYDLLMYLTWKSFLPLSISV
nr:NADH dehydrogenase subunit 1 [Whitmania laevis]YP_009024168.1 NADH dehydrogenase subunit 1 [Whitmania acranulata]AGL34598.1 NADH dehydrogenase subunit 1 [Whitmania laevis]AGL34624.1 NADH dehydrogenase subunit 1 [Whitmania acranulata]